MTPKQLKYVNRLLEREGLYFAKEDYANVYSNGRTLDLAFLTHKETQTLINSLVAPDATSKMKRKILSMAHEMRWETAAGNVDFKKLNAWCVKYTPSHTDFNGIPAKYLPKVVSVFEKMYKEFLKTL